MSHPRLALVEHLGAPGAAAADARARAGLLQEAGFDVHTYLCDPARSAAAETCEPLGARPPAFGADRAGLTALRDAVLAAAPALAIIASPEPGGASVTQALPKGLAARWWPTLFDPRAAPGTGAPPLVPAMDPLAWAAGDPPRSTRPRLPLWDGDFVLAPLPLVGRAGAQLIEAFAGVVEDTDALDLVVLGDPQPEFEALARRLGVGTRVHFAGVAPRDAEFAWWASSSSVVFAAECPFSAGMVWRALECGAALLVAGDAAVPAALRAWLDGQGCLAGARAGGGPDLAAAMSSALAGEPVAREAAARGRARARAQADALPARLAGALARRPEARAA